MNNLLAEIETSTKKTYKIKDVGRVVTGKTPSKDNPLDWGQEVDFITPSDFSGDDKFLPEIKRRISKEGVNRYKNMILPPESVVVTCIGSDMGKVVVSQRVALTNQQINSIIVDRDIFDIDFIFYKLKSLYPELRSIAEEGGSTMPIITKTTFENIEFDAPELSIQKRIAEILGVYDEKIGNNNLIIKNLEATAQILFDEWFVKFNFPGHEKVGLVESEMGEIPEGWKVQSVLDVIERIGVGKKYDNKSALLVGRTPILDQGKSGNIGYHDDEPGVVASIENPVVVFTNHTCYYRLMTEPFSCIQNVLPYKGRKGYSTLFVYFLTKEKIKMQEYKGHWPDFEQQDFVLPPTSLADMFTLKIQPLIEKMTVCEQENNLLKQSSDLLLSKLV